MEKENQSQVVKSQQSKILLPLAQKRSKDNAISNPIPIFSGGNSVNSGDFQICFL